jgi:dCTP diphosphatase
MSMAIEVGELMEHFRFRSDAEIAALLRHHGERLAVAHELADVLYHVLALSSALDIDLSAVFRDKLSISAAKYPANVTDLQERTAS